MVQDMSFFSFKTQTSSIALKTVRAAAGFDLEGETGKLLQDFPTIRENTLFAMADVYSYNPDDLKLYGHPQALRHDAEFGGMKKLINMSLEVGSSLASPLTAGANYQNNIVAINPHVGLALISELHAFEHEAGHLVTPTGHDDRLAEATADAYMALRMLQRQGVDAVESLSRVSAMRAHGFLLGGLNEGYLTTTVIDRIIQDSKTIDFEGFTPEETANLASKYAQENYPEDTDIDFVYAAHDLYFKDILASINNPKEHKKIPELLAGTVLSSVHPLTFYIGAKLFQPFLSAEGSSLDGKKIILPEKIRQEAQAKIVERAAHFNLQAHFQNFDMRQNKLLAERGVSKRGFKDNAQSMVQKLETSLKSMFSVASTKHKEKHLGKSHTQKQAVKIGTLVN
jgi:hypothetical protein